MQWFADLIKQYFIHSRSETTHWKWENIQFLRNKIILNFLIFKMLGENHVLPLFFQQHLINVWQLRRPVVGIWRGECCPISFCSTALGLLSYFLFHDAPNVFSWWKIHIASFPVQHPDFSTTKPCCRSSFSMQFSIVLLKNARPSLK